MIKQNYYKWLNLHIIIQKTQALIIQFLKKLWLALIYNIWKIYNSLFLFQNSWQVGNKTIRTLQCLLKKFVTHSKTLEASPQ